jgi:hypothetical protein
MTPEQKGRLLDLVKDCDIDHNAFVNDTEQLMDLIHFPIGGDLWFDIRDEIQPLSDELKKALDAVQDNAEAMTVLNWSLLQSYGRTDFIEAVREAVQQDYSEPLLTLHTKDLAVETDIIFGKHGLPISSDSNSLFVEFLTFMVEVTGFLEDPHKIARHYLSEP